MAALVALYESTGGDHWGNNTKWLSGTPLSEWLGVETDENGRVTSLSLLANGLTPETIGQLNNLQYLWLSDNQLTGPIPETLGQLENLRYLYLNDNELTGCIPSALQAISFNDLDDLGLAFCQ